MAEEHGSRTHQRLLATSTGFEVRPDHRVTKPFRSVCHRFICDGPWSALHPPGDHRMHLRPWRRSPAGRAQLRLERLLITQTAQVEPEGIVLNATDYWHGKRAQAPCESIELTAGAFRDLCCEHHCETGQALDRLCAGADLAGTAFDACGEVDAGESR